MGLEVVDVRFPNTTGDRFVLRNWLARNGEIVRIDEPLYEFEVYNNDVLEAICEMASPATGILSIRVPQQTEIHGGTLISVLE
jgi:hypothetical protein